MAGWSTSTQRARWILRPEELAERRRRNNERASAHVVKVHEQHGETEQATANGDHSGPGTGAGEGEGPGAGPGPEPGGGAGAEAGAGRGAGAGAGAEGEGERDGEGATGTGPVGAKRRRGKEGGGERVEVLSVDEERELCQFYEWKIVEICKAFQFKPKVQATAMQYFKRFFLRHSVMEFDPKCIMLTVVYVACKVDEAYVSAEALGGGIKQDPQIVLSNELAVLQALDFDLICHGPHKPIQGFLYSWQQQQPQLFASDAPKAEAADKGQPGLFKELEDLAFAHLPSLLATDAPLLFPPAQLGLSALRLAVSQHGSSEQLLPHFNKYLANLDSKPPENGTPLDGPLERLLDDIRALVEKEGAQPDEGRVKRIDRKLRHCRDPALRKEEMRRRREKKGQSKAKKATHDTSNAPSAAAPSDPSH